MNGLIRYLEDLNNISYNLESIIKELIEQTADISTAAFMETINYYEYDALAILMSNLQQAIASSEEFNLKDFREPLLNAFDNVNVINYRLERGGNFISVNILAEEFGGTIDEYYQGVELARDQLRKGEEIGDITQASAFWSMMYNAGRSRFAAIEGSSKEVKAANKKRKKNFEKLRRKYFDTIHTRLSFFTKAPYWNIIDKGTFAFTDFDRGGFPTPKTSPKGFIYKSQVAIETLINQEYTRIYEKWYNSIERDLDNLVGAVADVNQAALASIDRSRPVYFETLRKEYDIYVTPKLRLVGATQR